MRPDTINHLNTLANRLLAVKKRGQPYGLYLGANASRVTPAQAAFESLREEVMRSPVGRNLTQDVWDAYPPERKETEFAQTWRPLGAPLQQQFVTELTQRLRPSAGYKALARILEAGIFRPVFTSNADDLLEQELSRLNLLPELAVSEDDINNVFRGPNVATNGLTIVKLGGSFRVGRRYHVTVQQITERAARLANVLTRVPMAGLVMLGYSQLDEALFTFLEKPDPDPAYFVGQSAPPGDWRNYWERFRENSILDPALDFDRICSELAKHLGLSEENLVELLPPDSDEAPLIEIFSNEDNNDEVAGAVSPSEVDELLVDVLQHGVFTVRVTDDNRVSFNLSGRTVYESERSQVWEVEVAKINTLLRQLGDDMLECARRGDRAGLAAWRQRAKDVGAALYDTLVNHHSDLGQQLAAARVSLRKDEILTLNFLGPREHLGLPYELLNDSKNWLAHRYPLCRHVTGVQPNHSDTLDQTILNLRREDNPLPLRVLLIAADTGKASIAVDWEVTKLKELLMGLNSQALRVEVDSLLTPQATLTEVEKRLTNCRYHLVHFAGHGDFDAQDPERSGLRLFLGEKRTGGISTLTARKLSQLLYRSEVRLFYLSCCVGAAVGERAQLRHTDYLGVMDALVQAGVPYVLGYRWYVQDVGSLAFAQYFYDHLLRAPYVPEYAVWEARKKIYQDEGNDETWASPLLVAQNVQR